MIFEEQISMEDNPAYAEFVGKFKPKKTTDDCYTPPLVFEAVCNWACSEFDIDPGRIVRPFYPGGDYKRFDYPEGCVVLDNPPFSILSEILRFYLQHAVDFFLFAPSLTSLASARVSMQLNHIFADAKITYANGAVVPTAFVTNFGAPCVVRTAPELGAAINAACSKSKSPSPAIAKYAYPDAVLTAAMAEKYAHRGIDFRVSAQDCCPVAQLDAQKSSRKAIFGSGLLLSQRAAAEKAAAEKAAAIVWKLSAREIAMIEALDQAAGAEKEE